jgi:hypothetical protein
VSGSERGGDRPSVWDADGEVAVTTALCAAGCRLWTAQLPDAVVRATAASMARIANAAVDGMGDPSVADLLEVSGYPRGAAPDQRARDPITLATVGGYAAALALERALGHLDAGELVHLVVGAALDALGATEDLAPANLSHAHAVACGLAPTLQGVFDDLGIAPRRTAATTALLVAGVATVLVRRGPDPAAMARVVGLLASCSAGTGPVPSGGRALALVVGKGAGDAIRAEFLVARGFTTNPTALEAARGLFRALGDAHPGDAAATAFEAATFQTGVVASARTEPPS